MAHFKKASARDHFLSLAQYHHEQGLRMATVRLQQINEEVYPALYIFGTFCHMYTLGMGPKKGDFLLFSDSGLAEWLVLFRGVKSMIESNFSLLRDSDLAPLFQISISIISQPMGSNEHLEELKKSIISMESENPEQATYLDALERLCQSFPTAAVSGIRPTQASPQVVFVWLFRLKDRFVECLQHRHPVALVILAHFCVLLNDLSSLWWMQKWTQHLLSEIYNSLDQHYRIWIRWPIEEIGWIPES
jgi:hypothetical protein